MRALLYNAGQLAANPGDLWAGVWKFFSSFIVSKEEEAQPEGALPYDAENRALMPDIVKGDEEAFMKFYNNTKREVFAYCLRLSKSKEATEEIMQQAYIAFWQQRHRNSNLLYPKAYVLRICSKLVWKWFALESEKRRIIELNENVTAFNIPYEEAPIQSKEIMEMIEEAVLRLPPRQQQVFRMNKLQGYSLQEIMVEMDLSYKGVESNLGLAMKYVRKYLSSRR